MNHGQCDERWARGVVVHGMGRSGTSAITGLFVASGYYAGEAVDLMRPDPSNERGYYENLSVFGANEEVLGEFDASWYDPADEATQTARGDELRPRLAAVLDRLVQDSGSAPLALKDPRIGVMLPLWGPVLSGVLHPVLVIRDPIEIAFSLRRREDMPVPLGIAAWEVHMTTLLRHLAGVVVTVAPYRAVMAEPGVARAVVAAASEHMAVAQARCVHPSDGSDWLAPELRHNNAQSRDRRRYLTASQQELWTWLESLEPGNCELRPPPAFTEIPDASRAAVHQLSVLADRISGLEQGLSRERQGRQDDQQRAAEAYEHVQRVSDEAREAYEQTEKAYQVIVQSKSWRLTSLPRTVASTVRRLLA